MDAALEQFEAQRLPDMHALFRLDVTAIARAGGGWGGAWNPHRLRAMFHLVLWGGMTKLLSPACRMRPPELMGMVLERLPYRQVGHATAKSSTIVSVWMPCSNTCQHCRAGIDASRWQVQD